MDVNGVKERCEAIMEAMSGVIVGKEDAMARLTAAALANGHVLLEDYPGLAKTLMAKSFSQAIGLSFKRVQFTPDLLPSDITGSYILDQRTGTFNLRKGPAFTNVLLADEINRAPPKAQSALLEAMEERQVTLDGEMHELPDPFIVIATQNPIEYEGTYPLPEAQVDRFLVKMGVGYTTAGEEARVLRMRKERGKDATLVPTVVTLDEFSQMRKAVEAVHIDDDLCGYIVDIVARTRTHPLAEVGASPRGSLALMKLSSARAAMDGRDYIIPEDVKFVAGVALSHRVILRPDPWIRGVRPEKVVAEVLAAAPVPKTKA